MFIILINNKGQISIEYLILTGFILLVIVVPAIIFLYTVANKSVYGTVNTQKINDLGNGLISNAKQMYYLGLYSKKIVEYEVPVNVEKMFILELYDGSKIHYYFGIIIFDEKERHKHYFPSDVPLMSDTTSLYVDDTDSSSYVAECASATCKFYNFIGPALRAGNKRFKIETTLDVDDVKVSIIPLID